MDFRGIGLSGPAFSPELQEDLMNLFLLNLTPDESRERYTGLLEGCFENLSSEGILCAHFSVSAISKLIEYTAEAAFMQIE